MASSSDVVINFKARTQLPGWMLIAAERGRQVDGEGYTEAHDDEHDDDLVRAAICYLLVTIHENPAEFPTGSPPPEWPWEPDAWKPTGDAERPTRNLIKAGALIAAEIDRLQRASAT
jgi:hypothetical protein